MERIDSRSLVHQCEPGSPGRVERARWDSNVTQQASKELAGIQTSQRCQKMVSPLAFSSRKCVSDTIGETTEQYLELGTLNDAHLLREVWQNDARTQRTIRWSVNCVLPILSTFRNESSSNIKRGRIVKCTYVDVMRPLSNTLEIAPNSELTSFTISRNICSRTLRKL
jgi:hypothetical protein